jgi:hypothetical protein
MTARLRSRRVGCIRDRRVAAILRRTCIGIVGTTTGSAAGLDRIGRACATGNP